jgi:hypothetical protein
MNDMGTLVCVCVCVFSLVQVDYTGFSTINTQRFGQRFVGKVANPNDIVLWQKAPRKKVRGNAHPL